MKLRPSLQRDLFAWILLAVLTVWLVFAGVGLRTGLHEADELTDVHLASVAALMVTQPLNGFGPGLLPHAQALGPHKDLKAHGYQESLSMVVWDSAGKVRARTGPAPVPRFESPDGFETLELGDPPTRWRVFTLSDDQESRNRKLAVLLSMDERDALARDITEHLIIPGLWLFPLVIAVLVMAIRRGLRPLHALSTDVYRYDIRRKAPLLAPPHAEFQTMVSAITTLSDRYSEALDRERQIADAFAHELRTPLSSLQLHSALLLGDLSHQDRAAALQQIGLDSARAAAVMSDLLALARANRTQLAEAQQDMDLADLARGVVAEYGQAAFESGQELSLNSPAKALMRGHPVLLQIALRNLVDNALAHTPAGTSIEVRVSAQPLFLEVCDNGRKLISHSAALASDRSWGLGLGLGHQVVRRIADVHQGSFDIIEPEGAGFCCYRISIADKGQKLAS